ncbi:hypothetical protein LCGC14_2113970 [marine sediment metagenome]|uniref:HNH nuclease domain-containing protein n=1 Tax=marine sediment metagenome TaxID=412755 RepID=A0A0F9E6C5_9ZZZZ
MAYKIKQSVKSPRFQFWTLRPSCMPTSAASSLRVILMKRISLTQGQFAIVDDKLFDQLNKFGWYAYWNEHTKTFYAVRHGKKKNRNQYTIYMAREILGLRYGDKRQGDHINHNTLDNRISNLRVVTQNQNQWNRKNPKGYCWDESIKKYMARIRLNGKSIYLGHFCTPEEAHRMYLNAKKLYHKIQSV